MCVCVYMLASRWAVAEMYSFLVKLRSPVPGLVIAVDDARV